MEGPTPVSALIHAATMVAAGVFLVARMFPLFEHSTEALTTVAVIGGAGMVIDIAAELPGQDVKGKVLKILEPVEHRINAFLNASLRLDRCSPDVT